MPNYKIKEGGLLVACAWCDHFIDVDNNATMLALPSQVAGKLVSHGICNACKDKLKRESGLLKPEDR